VRRAYDPFIVTDEATLRATVLRYFQCLDNEDWDGMREIWHEDATLRAVGARPRDDREGMIEYFAKIFVPWQKHEDRPTRLVISERDGTVMAEVTFTGVTADGRTVVFDAIDVFDLVDGRIKKLTNWYDIDYARKLLAPA
jgi:ketosteroid isomerase-like protein